MSLRPWFRPYLHVVPNIDYSTIVNRSQYRPDKLAKKEVDVGNTPSVSGCYDGVLSDVNCDSLSREIIALRENRLTREEISKIRSELQERALSENDQLQIELADKASKSRGKKLDKLIDDTAKAIGSDS